MPGFKNWREYGLFSQYDPFLTFADGQVGVKTNSFACNENEIFTEYPCLWRTGRDAYIALTNRIGHPPTEHELALLADEIIAFEKDEAWVSFVSDVIRDPRNTLQFHKDSPLINDIQKIINSPDYFDGWFTGAVAEIVINLLPFSKFPTDKIPDLECYLLGITIFWIDNAIIEASLGLPESAALSCLTASFSRAKTYREIVISTKTAIRSSHAPGAHAKHASEHKEKVKALDAWHKEGEKYKSVSSFVRHYCKKNTTFLTEETLTRYINKHKMSKLE